MPEESEESRANDVRPYNVPFPKRVNNSSALSGISSMRGDYFAKPPLQRRWQAAGLTVESRANNVCPYGVLTQRPFQLQQAKNGQCFT